ncbi:hypothetical protein HanPI659440_Chr15g0608461 [Helianthus annuus]|nr:hypothetical protein HanPI659440_Chr15g0608461 [Helianthus annuus]
MSSLKSPGTGSADEPKVQWYGDGGVPVYSEDDAGGCWFTMMAVVLVDDVGGGKVAGGDGNDGW